jgi:hypothetical protein
VDGSQHSLAECGCGLEALNVFFAKYVKSSIRMNYPICFVI